MDLAPPDDPQAQHSSQNQAAIDTIGRLAGMREWLAEQTAAMPGMPSAPDALDVETAFDAALAAYWEAPVASTPGAPAVRRADALARRMAATLRDMASLRYSDGTLDEGAVALIREATAPDGVPASVRASELMLGDVAYAGAVVLQHTGSDERALVFLPDRGWQAFASLADLLASTERTIRENLAGVDELPGITTREVETLGDEPFMRAGEADSDIFGTLVNRIIDVQAQRVEESRERFRNGLDDAVERQDDVRDALALHDHLDIHAILQHRDRLLTRALNEQRLARLPDTVRRAWTQARDDYRDTLHAATRERAEAGLEEPESLADFTRQQLKQRLHAEGVTDDPDDLVVTLTGTPLDLGSQLQNLLFDKQTETVTLEALAFRNVGQRELATLSIARRDGAAMSRALSSGKLRDIIRDTDAGTRYLAYLDARLDTASGAPVRQRDIATTLQLTRMRFELEESRLSIYLDDEPRAFPHGDRGEGYALAKAVLDRPSPADRPTVHGARVAARQVTYAGLPVADVLEIGVEDDAVRSTPRVVYYTPDAPDGIAFREFGSRAEATRELLQNPFFESYLVERLPDALGETAPNGTRRFAVPRVAAVARWFFAQRSAGFETAVGEHFNNRRVAGSMLDALYQAGLDRRRTDVLSTTRSTRNADTEGSFELFRQLGKVASPLASLQGETTVAGVIQGAQTLEASQRFYDNVRAGDGPAAFIDFTAAWTSGLNVIGVHPARGLRLPARRVRVSRQVTTTLPTRQQILPADAAFDSLYIARGVRADSATSVRQGLHRIGNETYISQGGHMYRVRPDPLSLADDFGNRPWRLARDSAAEATGPIVRRAPDGTWRLVRHGLLAGVGDDLPARPAHISNRRIAEAREHGFSQEFRNLSDDEMQRFWRELVAGTGSFHRALHMWRKATAPLSRLAGGDHPVEDLFMAARSGTWRQAMQAATGRPSLPAPPLQPVPRPPGRVVPRPDPREPRVAPRVVHVSRNRHVTRLTPDEWPAVVWIYETAARVNAWRGRPTVELRSEYISPVSTFGIRASTLPPDTLVASAANTGQFAPSSTLTFGAVGGGWIRVDLARIRGRLVPGGNVPFEIFRPGAAGHASLVIRPRTVNGRQACRYLHLHPLDVDLNPP